MLPQELQQALDKALSWAPFTLKITGITGSGTSIDPYKYSGVLTIKAQSFPFTIETSTGPMTIYKIETDLSNLQGLLMSDLSSYLSYDSNVPNPTEIIPPELGLNDPSANKIQIQNLEITYYQEKVQAINAKIVFIANTPIGFEQLQLNDLTFDFQASRGNQDENLLTFQITCHGTFAQKVHFSVEVDYPELNVIGKLQPGSTLSIQDFATAFTGSPDDNLPTLAIDQLEIRTNFYTKDFYFFAGASEGWEIPTITGKSIPLKDLQFTFSETHTKSENQSPSGPSQVDKDIDLQATLEIGGDVQVDAHYTTKEGWAFRGKLLEGEEIAIGKFFGELEKSFVNFPLPDPLEGLSITSLDIDIKVPPAPSQKDFNFIFGVTFPVEGKEVDLMLIASYPGKEPTPTLELTGTMDVAGLDFEIDFSRSIAKPVSSANSTNPPTPAPPSSKSILVATYEASDSETGSPTSLNFRTLVEEVSDNQILLDIIPNIDIKLEEVLFAIIKTAPNTSKYMFGVELDVPLEFSLSNLPVVGKFLKDKGAFGIKGFKFYLANQPFYQEDIKLLPEKDQPFIMGEAAKEPEQSDNNSATKKPKITILNSGINFRAILQLGHSEKVIPRPAGQTRAKAPTKKLKPAAPKKTMYLVSAEGGTPPKATSAVTDSQAQWINIQKTIGPLTVERIGVNYKNGKFWFFISASFTAAGLTIDLDGLGLGASLPAKGESLHISAQLLGMSLTFQGGPVEISGGFVESDDPNHPETHRYAGEVLVKAPPFNLSAIGMYTSSPKMDSFFAFAMLDVPLGGPPIFFVTGLAAGFGYNSMLNIPPIEYLNKFLLVRGALPPAEGTNPLGEDKNDPGKVLQMLLGPGASGKPDVEPLQGEDWAGVGVRFMSYELVQSFALLTVSFGVHFEVAILGRSQITIPTGAPDPIAFAEIDLEAILIPDAQVPTPILAVEARLANGSHIFSKDCHLMGGFAFYFWENGDFVITFGGYHPHFRPPSYYPRVDRVGILWQLGSHLMVKGGLYFALTPSAIMAGGGLEATFHAGPIHAWFIAEANFLLSWKPFHYELSIRICIGISAHLGLIHINIHVGVGLELWGPKFGGIAKVDLSIISFTIRFGAGKPNPPALSWEEFADSFLPKQKKDAKPLALGLAASPTKRSPKVTDAKVTIGAIKNDAQYGVIVNPMHFEIATHTMVPAESVQVNSFTPDEGVLTSGLNGVWNKKIGIIPMKTIDISSVHHIILERKEDNDSNYQEYEYTQQRLIFEGEWKDAAKALWTNKEKQTQQDQLAEGTTIPGSLMGIRISPKKLKPDQTQAIEIHTLQEELEELILCEDFPAAPTKINLQPTPSTLSKALANIGQGISGSQSTRQAILSDLNNLGFSSFEAVNSQHFTDPSFEALDQSPIFRQ
jgi:hypothetical protein